MKLINIALFAVLFCVASIASAITVDISQSYNGSEHHTHTSSNTIRVTMSQVPTGTLKKVVIYQKVGSGGWQNIAGATGSIYNKTVTVSENQWHRYKYEVRGVRSNALFATGDVHPVMYIRKPGVPSSITVSPTSSTSTTKTVSWPAVSYATKYTLQQQTNDGSWVTIQDSSARSKTVTELTKGRKYEFRVRACRVLTRTACSDYRYSSNTYVAPEPPSSITVSPVDSTDGSQTISHTSSSGATSYKVYQQKNDSSSWPLLTDMTPSGLESGKYRYRVQACIISTVCGAFRYSGFSYVARTPGATTTNAGNPDTDEQFTLSWGASLGTVDKYIIEAKSKGYGESTYGDWSTVTEATTTSKLIPNVTDGHHQYRVRAQKGTALSDPSAVSNVTMLRIPNVPVNFRILNHSGADDNSFLVKWDNQSRRVTRYDLEYDYAAYGDTSTYINRDFIDLDNDTDNSSDQNRGDGHHRYRVRACNEADCSGWSDYKIVTVLNLPGAPTGLTIDDQTDVSDRTFKVSWGAASGLVNFYRVYRQERSYNGTFGPEALYEPSVSVSDRYISENEDAGVYRYRIEACNDTGCTTSGIIDATVLEKPDAPSTVTLVPDSPSDGSFIIRITYGAGLQTHIELQQQIRQAGTTNWSAWAPDPSGSDASYIFDASGNNDDIPLSRSAFGSSGQELEYQFRIRSCHEDIDATNPDDKCSDWLPTGVYKINPPGTPSNLVLSGISDGTSGTVDISDDTAFTYNDDDGDYVLSWDPIIPQTDTLADLQGNQDIAISIRYELQESTDNWATHTELTDSSYTTASYPFTGQPDGAYQYRLRAWAETPTEVIGYGDWTYPFGVDVRHRPDVPTNVRFVKTDGSGTEITFSTDGSYALHWDEVTEHVTEYRYIETNSLGDEFQQQGVLGTDVPFTDRPDDLYTYVVSACNGNVCSNSSPQTIDVLETPSRVGNVFNNGSVVTSAVTFVSEGDGLVSLNWNPPASGSVEYYETRLKDTTSNTWLAGWARTANDGVDAEWSQNLPEGNYFLRIRAVNRLSAGKAKDRPFNVRLAPAPVAEITGPQSAFGSFELGWTAPSGTVTHYKLNQRAEGGTWQLIYEGTELSENINNLPDGIYEFRVRGCNESNCGLFSPVKLVTVGPQALLEGQPAPAQHNVPSDPVLSDQIGSINGSFRVNESGAATYSIPLMSAPGTAGVAPSISLNYSSQGGNGLAGLGWSIGGLSEISRCRQTYQQDMNPQPITWTDDDRFCLDGQRLIMTSDPNAHDYGDNNTTYRTEIDSFAEVTLTVTSGKPDYFVVTRKDGSTAYYGAQGAHSSEFKPDTMADVPSQDVLSWSIRRVEDSVGNPIEFIYDNNADTGHRISEIHYAYNASGTSAAKIVFGYSARDDQVEAHLSDRMFKRTKRLDTISSYNDGALLRRYNLSYVAPNGVTVTDDLSRIWAIEECAGNGGSDVGTCLEETTFDWQLPRGLAKSHESQGYLDLSLESNNSLYTYTLGDINGDGYQDIAWLELDEGNMELAYSFYEPSQRAYGAKDILVNVDGGTNYYEENANNNNQEMSVNLVDYNADGRMDLMVWREHHETVDLFLSVPQVDGSWKLIGQTGWSDDSTGLLTGISDKPYFVDINADGLADIVSSAGASTDHYVLQRNADPSSSSTAYSYEPFSFPVTFTESYRYADKKVPMGDINGDGLIDFAVRVMNTGQSGTSERGIYIGLTNYTLSNGQPSYSISLMPTNLGAMTEDFDERLRNADMNGDGLTDILLLKNVSGSWQWKPYFSTGVDIALNEGVQTIFSASSQDNGKKKGPGFMDLNADGYQDVYWHEFSASQLKVRYWNPQTRDYGPQQVLSWINSGVSYDEDDSYQFVYLDADAEPDFIRLDNNGAKVNLLYPYTSTTLASPANVIEKITNGLGAVTEIVYENLSETDHYMRIEGIQSQTVPAHTEQQCLEWQAYGYSYSDCMAATIQIQNTQDFYKTINDPFDGLENSLQPELVNPVLELFGPMAVVTRVDSSSPIPTDPNSNNYTLNTAAKAAVEYSYEQAKIQAGGRGMLGFKALSTFDVQTGTLTRTRYRQDWPFIGHPLETKVKAPSGAVMSSSENDWNLVNVTYDTASGTQKDSTQQASSKASMQADVQSQGTSQIDVVQPYLAKSIETSYLVNSDKDSFSVTNTVGNTIITESFYDNHGNPRQIKVQQYGGVPNPSEDNWLLETVTDNDYASDISGFVSARYGRLEQTDVTTRKKDSAGDLQDTQVRRSAFEYDPTTGLLEKEIIHDLDTSDGDHTLTTTYAHDAYGNVEYTHQSGVVDAGGGTSTRSSQTFYENDEGRYVSKTQNDYGQTISEVTARNHYGVPTSVEDITGQVFETAYSGMGRKYWEATPTGSYTHSYLTSSVSGCPTGTAYKAISKGVDNTESQECFDTLGRSVRTLTKSFNGQWVHQDVQYDIQGRVARQSEPYTGSASYWTEFEYDLLGRVTQTTLPDDSEGTVEYLGLQTRTTNDAGHTVDEYRDAIGNVYRVVNNATQGSADEKARVDYLYDALGNLTVTKYFEGVGDLTQSAEDAQADFDTTLTYDSLGRKISMSDADKGDWVYAYNAFGELIEQTSANQGSGGSGITTVMAYDDLGRMVARTDFDYLGSEEGSTVWVYDDASSAGNTRGRLLEVNYDGDHYLDTTLTNALDETPTQDMVQTYDYDAYGRQYAVTTKLGDNGALGTFINATLFDSYGRPSKTFEASSLAALPAGQDYLGTEIIYQDGYQQKVLDLQGNTLHEIVEMNARGQVVLEHRHNMATRTFYLYEADTGRLCYKGTRKGITGPEPVSCSDHAAVSSDINDIQDLFYAWDNLGNLTQRHEYSGTKTYTETFQYDHINRLTHAIATGTPTPVPTKIVTYDSLGNIKSKTGVGDYSYGAGNAGPHAVTSITGPEAATYTYDANGNNLTGDGRTLKYTSFDKVYEITKGDHTTSFAYGADRSRFLRLDTKNSTGEQVQTLYVGNTEYRSNLATGELEIKRMVAGVLHTLHYDAGSGSDPTETKALIFTDHLGSTDVITDHLGNIIQEQSFDAWGARRNASNWQHLGLPMLFAQFSVFNQPETTQGFTGHEMLDEVGIIHMNGRIYDAKLGRFLQADPFIQAPYNTQSHNRYSYTLNNPLNATDPSGYFLSSLVKKLKKFAAPILTIAAAAFCQACAASIWAAMGTGAAIGGISAGLNGGNILQGVALGALSGAAFYGIGDYFQGLEAANNAGWNFGAISRDLGVQVSKFGLTTAQQIAKIAAHSIVGGVMSVLRGGKFGHGFAAAGVTAGFGGQIDKIQNTSGRVAAAAVVGGTASKITGGKFANGAITGAFSRYFNEENHLRERTQSRFLPNDPHPSGYDTHWESVGWQYSHLKNKPIGDWVVEGELPLSKEVGIPNTHLTIDIGLLDIQHVSRQWAQHRVYATEYAQVFSDTGIRTGNYQLSGPYRYEMIYKTISTERGIRLSNNENALEPFYKW